MEENKIPEEFRGGEGKNYMRGGTESPVFEPTINTTGGKKRRGGGPIIKPLSGGNADKSDHTQTMGGKRNRRKSGKSRNSGKSRKNRKSRSRSRK